MRRLTKWLVGVALVLVLLFVVAALVLPSAFSTSLAIVRSSSMGSAMPAGSLAVVSSVDPATVVVGDIIAFTPPWDTDVTVSHRVVDMQDGGFVTKGDAVEDADPYLIYPEYVTGRVSWHVPYIGYVLSDIRSFTSTTGGLVVLVVVPALVILGSAVSDAYFMYSPRKRRDRLLRQRRERVKRRTRGSWSLGRAI